MGSVIVSNLKTGVRRGGWDKAEVLIYNTRFLLIFCIRESLLFRFYFLIVIKTLLDKDFHSSLPFAQLLLKTISCGLNNLW